MSLREIMNEGPVPSTFLIKQFVNIGLAQGVTRAMVQEGVEVEGREELIFEVLTPEVHKLIAGLAEAASLQVHDIVTRYRHDRTGT